MKKPSYLWRSLAFTVTITSAIVSAGWFFSRLDSYLKLQQIIPDPVNLIGVLPLTLGFLLRFWASSLFYMKGQKIISQTVPSSLTTTGPYMYSRNPLYLALILQGLGTALVFNSLSFLVLSVLGAILLHVTVVYEEKELESAFGEEYLSYRRRVRRWV